MDKIIEISNPNNNYPITAKFNLKQGLNLNSLKIKSHEIICQSTRDLFKERCAGLGALIGPHFHHRNRSHITWPQDLSIFRFLKKLKAQDSDEPFSHGIARYVPWEVTKKASNCFEARLLGKHKYKNIYLKDLEAQDFELKFKADISNNKLNLNYKIKSENNSVIGFHYYYQIEKSDISKSFVSSEVQNYYLDKTSKKSIPNAWLDKNNKNILNFNTNQIADFGFQPKNKKSNSSEIALHNPGYKLKLNYTCDSEDNRFQIYRPDGVDYVCIEPISAMWPYAPKRKSSQLNLELSLA